MKRLKIYKDGNKTCFIAFDLTKEETDKIHKQLKDIIESEETTVNDLEPSSTVALERPADYKGIPWEKYEQTKIINPKFLECINKNYLKMSEESRNYLLKEDMGPWLSAIESVETDIKFVKNYIYAGRDIFISKILSWMEQKGKKSDYKEGSEEYAETLKELILESRDEDLAYVFSVLKKMMI